eukprot:TRINITY_DN1636_c0_g1_i1.p1 TRINITY_DN1636_c0_g1~~TRINITY_DN1636_c0_g1_i1.p1  ORF type:complete len:484 (-),score=106.67 TRINITY_DN1636_c0_g1_i1:1955-3406(-)
MNSDPSLFRSAVAFGNLGSLTRVRTMTREEFIASRSFPNTNPTKPSEPNPNRSEAIQASTLPVAGKDFGSPSRIRASPLPRRPLGRRGGPSGDLLRRIREVEEELRAEHTFNDELRRRAKVLGSDITIFLDEDRPQLISYYESRLAELRGEDVVLRDEDLAFRSSRRTFAPSPVPVQPSDNLSAQKSYLEAEVRRLRTILSETEDEVRRAQDDKFRAPRSTDTREVLELRAEVERLRREALAASNRPQANQELEETVRLAQQSADRERQNALRAEDAAQALNEELTRTKVRLVVTLAELERISKGGSQSAQEREELARALANAERMRASEVAELRAQNERLMTQLADREKRLREAQLALSEVDTARRRAADAEDRRLQSELEIDRLRAALQQRDADNAALSKRLAQSDLDQRAEIDRLRRDHERQLASALAEERERLRKSLEDFIARISRLEASHITEIQRLREDFDTSTRQPLRSSSNVLNK